MLIHKSTHLVSHLGGWPNRTIVFLLINHTILKLENVFLLKHKQNHNQSTATQSSSGMHTYSAVVNNYLEMLILTLVLHCDPLKSGIEYFNLTIIIIINKLLFPAHTHTHTHTHTS